MIKSLFALKSEQLLKLFGVIRNSNRRAQGLDFPVSQPSSPPSCARIPYMVSAALLSVRQVQVSVENLESNGGTACIAYAVEYLLVSAAQLTNWSGSESDADLIVTGPCPMCGDDAPNSIPVQVTAFESFVPVGRRTVLLTCTCNSAHPGRPDNVSSGCGRSWIAVAVSDAGLVTLEPLQESSVDPELRAALQELHDIGPAQLDDVRRAAEKWIGGVTALFSLLGVVGITVTRDTVTSSDILWQILIGIPALVAVTLAGFSIFRIYQAAYGWPTTSVIHDDTALRAWYRARETAPLIRAGHLRAGVLFASLSLATLVATAGLLWFAPRQPTPSPLTRATLTDGSQVCGTLLPASDMPGPRIRRASDGSVTIVPLPSLVDLSAVASC
jgi:hypothetical protein